MAVTSGNGDGTDVVGSDVAGSDVAGTGAASGVMAISQSLLELADHLVPGAHVSDLGGFTSDNLRLRARGTDLVLRLHDRGVSRRRVLGEQRLREHLAKAGLTVALAQTVGRSTAGALDGQVFELEPFLPHRRLEDGWDNHAWLFTQMGRIQRAAAGLALDLPRRWMTHFAQPSTLAGWLRRTADHVCGDAAALEVVARSRSVLARARRAWPDDVAGPGSGVVSLIVHGDVKYDNVGVGRDGEAVILDFGHAAVRPRIHDLAFTLAHTVFAAYTPQAMGIDPADIPWERVPGLIEAYEAAAGWQLTGTERRWLGPYLATVPLFFPAAAYRHPDPGSAVHWRVSMLPAAEWVLDHPDLFTG